MLIRMFMAVHILYCFAPLMRIQSKNSKLPIPWFNDLISEKIKIKNSLRGRAQKSGSGVSIKNAKMN